MNFIAALRVRCVQYSRKADLSASNEARRVLLRAANHNSQEWKEAHQRERDVFWLVPSGGCLNSLGHYLRTSATIQDAIARNHGHRPLTCPAFVQIGHMLAISP
jgi:hypothetical protein